MTVIKCGTSTCLSAGPGSSYSMRLTEAPTRTTTPTPAHQTTVTVALVTDGQTVMTPTATVKYQPVGGPVPKQLFVGHIATAGTTISLATGSQLANLVTDGFAVGQLIQLTTAGGNSGEYTIQALTASTITVTRVLATGSFPGAKVSRVVDEGVFHGAVTVNVCAKTVTVGGTPTCQGTLTTGDLSSWLTKGFVVGTLFQINGSGSLYKVESVTSTSTAHPTDVLWVTVATVNPTTGAETVALLPLPTGAQTVSLEAWAAAATFTSSTWYKPVTIPVLADPYFTVPAATRDLLKFPKVPHLLSSIQGPLSVQGGPTTDIYGKLTSAVMLPGETNAAPFGIANQPTESQQVNVLNVFNDGSQQDSSGTLSSTTLTGFGLGKGLTFEKNPGYTSGGPTFGEPATFPSGISFGSITVGTTGKVSTNASLSTIQVLNVMLGSGNTHLVVTGSLVDGPYATTDGKVCVKTNGKPCTFVQGSLTVVQGGGAHQIVAASTTEFSITANSVFETGYIWATHQFAVGQELLLTGQPLGTVTKVTGSTLTYTGRAPATKIGTSEKATIAVFAPAISSTAAASSPFTFSGDSITRTDLHSWREFGFTTGQEITVNGVLARTISSITGATTDILTFYPCATAICRAPTSGTTVAVFSPTATKVAYGGNHITILGGGGPGPGLTPPMAKNVAVVEKPGATTQAVSTLSRTTGSWLTTGFVFGMVVTLTGKAAWTVKAVTAGTLTLSGTTLTSAGKAVTVTATGFAPSPLVVYGGTTQAGKWYSGNEYTMSGQTFGSKPFPNQVGNGSSVFVFPVAVQFAHAGNNVINASKDFATVPETQVPSVGLVLYGGSGNDTIYGSQAPDFIAGGSGNNTIYGERGANILLGSNGVNVTVITRTVSFPTANTSVYPNADPLVAGNNLIYGNTATGETTTDAYQNYNNVIFGAMGVVTQTTKTATVGFLRPASPVTAKLKATGSVLNGIEVATLTCPTTTPCFSSTDTGLTVSISTYLSTGTVIATLVTTHGVQVAVLSRNTKSGTTLSVIATVGPAYGYCRPTGIVSNTPYCTPSGTTAWTTPRLETLQTTGDVYGIASTQPYNHGNDTLYGSGGDNVIVGGDGTDNIQGGPGRNLIIGGSVSLTRRTGRLFNYTNPRFQNLSGTLLYTVLKTTGTGKALTNGTPQTDPTQTGTCYPGLKQECHTWWGDFLSNGNAGKPGIQLSVPLGTTGVSPTLQDSTVKGADYIAGGPGSSMIFGESNTNIIQAHGSIDITDATAGTAGNGSVATGTVFPGAASCLFRGFPLGNRVGSCRNSTNLLQLNQSADNYTKLEYASTGTFRLAVGAKFCTTTSPQTCTGEMTITRTDTKSWKDFGFAKGDMIQIDGVVIGVVTALTGSTTTVMTVAAAGPPIAAGCASLPCTISKATVVAMDGSTYVEGGRGNNTIFGDGGQNTLIGGNSNMFSLTTPAERASGSNLIFGGSGSNAGRSTNGTAIQTALRTTSTTPKVTAALRYLAESILGLLPVTTTTTKINGTKVSGAAFTTTDVEAGSEGHTIKGILSGTLAGTAEPSTAANAACRNGLTKTGTTTIDAVNCNIYPSKNAVWLNGGPVAGEIGAGTYYFAVLVPGNQPTPNDSVPNPANLSYQPGSGDVWTNREFTVTGTKTLGYTITYTGTHAFDAANGRIQLMPYATTTNPGGVYILAICSVPSTVSATNPPGVSPSNCKYDAFKVQVTVPSTPTTKTHTHKKPPPPPHTPPTTTKTSCANTSCITPHTPAGGSGARDRQAIDSNVIVANNGDVVRPVGTGNTTGQAPTGGVISPLGYLTFNYDLYGNPGATEWIVPRAVTRLDYTPGGPDLAQQPGPLVTGSKATNGVGDIGGTPETATVGGTTEHLQKGSEIHATPGGSFIFGGPANDVIYGGSGNDNINLGYGDNWVSGGRGRQCIVVSGLCLTSRVSSTYGEPLYGIAAIPAAQISELIATPGNVQQAVINVTGALKYTSYLWPFSWDPTTSLTNPTWANGCKTNTVCPPYWSRYGHNIIYGGWGSDTIFGGPGDSAISGAEAPVTSYTDNFSNTCTFATAALNGETCTATYVTQLNKTPIESDWYHPFNPGNVLGYTTPAKHNGPNPPYGKFKMFTETNPRRKVMLTSTGAFCTPTTTGCLPWIMDYTRLDIHAEPTNNFWSTGTPYAATPWSGTDLIFGDLGNDWIMGGQGRSQVFGGFGNDLIDMRATLTVGGGLNLGPVPNPLNGQFGTPGWEGLAYGGAGQDIFFAGTAGDRLIDWVGNHNSYYVPFSPFGMPTVSRTLMPFLPQFLYALSKSDGADQLLGLRYGGAPTRNGEPFGELGLVLQHDAAWHTMMGPPFNKMPENLGGVAVDVKKTANIRPIESPGTDHPPAPGTGSLVSLTSGIGADLPSGTNATGSGAVPFRVTGVPGDTVTYTFSLGTAKVFGVGMIGAGGVYVGTVDLSGFTTGNIAVTVVITGYGKTTKVQKIFMKDKVPPSAPTFTTPTYVNNQNQTVFDVTVTGEPGSIANVVVTDGGTPVSNVVNGMDFIGTSGSVVIPIWAALLDTGTVTVSVTLTNGAGNSTATVLNVYKYTVSPPVTVSAPPYVNLANQRTYIVLLHGLKFATVTITATGSTGRTVSDSGWFKGSAFWTTHKWNLSKLADGPVTLTVTETDVYGNVSVNTYQVTKTTRRPGSPTVALTPASDSGPSNTDYITNVTTPSFLVTPGVTAVTTTVYVNGVPYVGQALATGTYTVTAVSFNVAGNPSYTAYAPKTLVIDTNPPTGSFSVKGTTLGGVTYTNNPTLTLSLAFSGAPAGLYQMAFSTNGGATFGAPVAYSTSGTVALPNATGTDTVAVEVTDLAGNSAVFTTLVDLVRTTATISSTITAPTNAGSYDVGQQVTLTASATAVDPVVSVTATLDGKAWSLGTALDTTTLAAGNHTVAISATDAAGNVTTETLTLAVHATVQGLVAAVDYGVAKGYITSSTAASALETALAKAQSAITANMTATAITDLKQFLSDLAKDKKVIKPSYAALLTGWASDLITRL
jgi:hypothetical protein